MDVDKRHSLPYPINCWSEHAAANIKEGILRALYYKSCKNIFNWKEMAFNLIIFFAINVSSYAQGLHNYVQLQ